LDRSALNETLGRANELIHRLEDPLPGPLPVPEGELYTGVDLGTAYLTMVVLDENHEVLAGEYTYAEVARDGLVVDYIGAVDLVREMKSRLEQRLGREMNLAGSGYPPGVAPQEVRATANVVEAGGFTCTNLVDEPTAANSLICLENGVIVDVGGGTTGIAVVEDGKVIYTADEATGGTHLSLVISGARDIPYAEAEQLKLDPQAQPGLFPTIRPVLEKVSSIVARHIDGHDIPEVVLVGGTTKFHRAAEVVEEYTKISTWVPNYPEWVTPIGMAMNSKV
jgi:ethanolamine utilization protein EutJ